jgi:hypothetical protein
MALTTAQVAIVTSMQTNFADLKSSAKTLMAQAKAANDAVALNAAYASFAAICTAHAACSDRLLQIEPSQGGGIVIQGPAR